MKNSLADQLVHFLFTRRAEWVHKGELLRMVWKDRRGKTYLPDTVSRQLRLAEELRMIAVKSDGSKSILYKWLPFDRRQRYIPTSSRIKGQESILFRPS